MKLLRQFLQKLVEGRLRNNQRLLRARGLGLLRGEYAMQSRTEISRRCVKRRYLRRSASAPE